MNKDHLGLVKFRNGKDNDYIQFSYAIVECVKDAPDHVAQLWSMQKEIESEFY